MTERAARRAPWRLALLCAAVALAGAPARATAAEPKTCGERVTLSVRGGTAMPYALALPAGKPRATLVLLAGGTGHLDLDAAGCPRALTGNSLVRAIPLFAAAGFATALVDAPADYTGEDGLGGFRATAPHAADIGEVVADVRARIGSPVWLVGTSRGAISAANAAARLDGPRLPDGLVLTSPVTAGKVGGRKAWVAQTVFDLPLAAIRMPLLVIAHAEDRCLRSPPGRIGELAARTASTRQQEVTLSGGPGWTGAPGADACIGRAPHGFVEQEGEVVAGIARFIAGGRFPQRGRSTSA
jgi:hypothetical protein